MFDQESVYAVVSAIAAGQIVFCPGVDDDGDAARSDVLDTLEALLPQFQARCGAFYQTHPPEAHPLDAYTWMHRELIARFGPQETLSQGAAISLRLKQAALEVTNG